MQKTSRSTIFQIYSAQTSDFIKGSKNIQNDQVTFVDFVKVFSSSKLTFSF